VQPSGLGPVPDASSGARIVANWISRGYFGELLESDSQLVLPKLILEHTPVFAQIIFFGALLSAIMSCSSATLLAPSVAFSENIVRGFYPHMSDKTFLRIMRTVLVCFAGVVLLFALNTESTIFQMVENAYKITLVAAFIPLFAGLYWKRANTQGAYFAVSAGLVTWVVLEVFIGDEGIWPPQLVGLLASAAGMLAGSLLPHWVGRPTPQPVTHEHRAVHSHPISPELAEHPHHAASLTHHTPGTHHAVPPPRTGKPGA